MEIVFECFRGVLFGRVADYFSFFLPVTASYVTEYSSLLGSNYSRLQVFHNCIISNLDLLCQVRFFEVHARYVVRMCDFSFCSSYALVTVSYVRTVLLWRRNVSNYREPTAFHFGKTFTYRVVFSRN